MSILTINSTQSASKSLMIDFILSNLATNKRNDESLFTPVYTCETKDKQGLTWIELTTDELYAQSYDNYTMATISDLNDAITAEGVFKGVLMSLDGLCHYDYSKQSYVPYINDDKLVESFFNWLVYKEGFPIDGYDIRKLRECITAQNDIELFTKHYNDVFNNDRDYLLQCLHDIIDYYHSAVELPNYCEYR